MAISENTRVSASIATVISLVGAVALGGSIWGIYSTRVEALEAQASEQERELRELDKQLAESRAQYAEIIRRLKAIDEKIDWQERAKYIWRKDRDRP